MRRAWILLSASLVVVTGPTEAQAASAVLADATVRFQSGQAQLTVQSERILDRLAHRLLAQPELDPVLLIGHADDRGTREANIALSARRAETVKDALVRRGIKAARILTRGAGSSEPLSQDTTAEALAKNRRVEVWVTPKGPVAKVTTVRRKVLAQPPEATWGPAKIGTPLIAKAKVRTLKKSASEVTFRSRAKVTLGPQALVVIYGSYEQTEAKRARVRDVEIESGSIFARLAARSLPPLKVETKASRVEVASRKTRIDVRKRKTTTVSVFDGRSKVKAKGKTVEVKEGWGTRVEEGKAPEAPRPLPEPPLWKTRDPLVIPPGAPIRLDWLRSPGVPAVEVQLALGDDPNVERPVRLWKVEGDMTEGGQAQPGFYHLRLAGVDDRGVTGRTSRTLRLVVLPPPVDGAGVPLAAGVAGYRLPGPGSIRMPKLDGATAEVDGAQKKALWAPGRYALPITVSPNVASTASTATTTGALKTWLKIQVQTATVVVQTATVGPKNVAQAELLVVDSDGRPVQGLQLVAAQVARPTPYLMSVTSSGSARIQGALRRCACAANAQAVPLTEEGGGRYRLALPVRAMMSGAREPRAVLRVVDPRGPIALEFAVDLPQAKVELEGPRQSGLLLGLRLGGGYHSALDQGGGTFIVGGEVGARLHLIGPISLDLDVDLSWMRRTVQDRGLNLFPLLLRGALTFAWGWFRAYAGGGGGIRLSDGDQTAASAFKIPLGIGVRLGLAELALEGSFSKLDAVDGDAALTVWSVSLAYRAFPWGG